MNGAESLVATLAANGVDVCFGNPGTSEMHFVAALDKVAGVRCVLGLFEGVVTGAADGYYRMAGKPAATLLHLGPGLGNGIANLHNAGKARSGIVNIVGDHAVAHARSSRRCARTSRPSQHPCRIGSRRRVTHFTLRPRCASDRRHPRRRGRKHCNADRAGRRCVGTRWRSRDGTACADAERAGARCSARGCQKADRTGPACGAVVGRRRRLERCARIGSGDRAKDRLPCARRVLQRPHAGRTRNDACRAPAVFGRRGGGKLGGARAWCWPVPRIRSLSSLTPISRSNSSRPPASR
jgi:hypothetical protein